MTPQHGQFLVYQTQDGKLKIDIHPRSFPLVRLHPLLHDEAGDGRGV